MCFSWCPYRAGSVPNCSSPPVSVRPGLKVGTVFCMPLCSIDRSLCFVSIRVAASKGARTMLWPLSKGQVHQNALPQFTEKPLRGEGWSDKNWALRCRLKGASFEPYAAWRTEKLCARRGAFVREKERERDRRRRPCELPREGGRAGGTGVVLGA